MMGISNVSERCQGLSREEERNLFNRIKNGGNDAEVAREELVDGNLLLVEQIAGCYGDLGVSQEELIRVGKSAIYKAIDCFDPEKGWLFSTYVSWWIRKDMLNLADSTSGVIDSAILQVRSCL